MIKKTLNIGYYTYSYDFRLVSPRVDFYPIYKEGLVITIESLEKLKKILFIRNANYSIIKFNRNINTIIIDLNDEYTKEMLNKDLGGSIYGNFVGSFVKYFGYREGGLKPYVEV